MALMPESYSSVADITAVTRHLLAGETAYSTTTKPTLKEVESFIDDISSFLNIAIAGEGFATPITNAVAKRACDMWVRSKVVAWVEATQENTSFDGESNTNRADWFWMIFPSAKAWVQEQVEGWQNLGLSQSSPASGGLTFTGLNKHSERTDPTSSTLEQPKFRRGQWSGNSGV